MTTRKLRPCRRYIATTVLLAAALTSQAGLAATSAYCAAPLLYATNIRTACEQFGVRGLDALAEASKSITGMRAAVEPRIETIETNIQSAR